MPDSKAFSLIKSIQTRLEAIRISGGYQTDAGLRVFRGRTQFHPSHDVFPVLSLQAVSGETLSTDSGGSRQTEALAIVIEGHVEADPNNPQDAAHTLLADIKKAMDPSGDLVGAKRQQTSMTAAPEGWSIVDAELGSGFASVQARYSVHYVEQFGDPYQ